MESANMAGRNVQTYTLENKNTLRKLATLRNEGQLCDLMFIFPDGSQIEAHKAIVCQYSSVIKARCVDIDQHKLQVLCTDIDNEQAINPSILNIMLDYIYGLSITIRHEYIQDIMRLAIKLNIPEFLGDCDKILFENKALGPSDLMINAQNIKQEQTGSGYETGQASDFGMADQPLVTPSTSFDDTNLQEPIDEKAAKPPGRRKRKATKVVKANVEQLPEPQSDEEDDMMDNPLDDDTDEYEADNFTAIKAEEADSDYNESASPKKRKRSKAKKTTVSTKRSHQKKTATLDPLFCKECDQKFDAYKDAAEHHKGAHNLIVCDVCAKIFDNEADLRRHSVLHSENLLNVENGTLVYICQDCGQHFPRVYFYKKHMKEVHKKEPFQCKPCGLEFHLSKKYINHILRSHHGLSYKQLWNVRTTECEDCGVMIQTNNVARHKQVCPRNKDVVKPFPCDICEKAFFYISQLKEHKGSHNQENDFECDICHKKYKHAKGLDTHMKYYHLKLKKMSECKTCHLKLSSEALLQRHYHEKPECVTNETELKNYRCSGCGKIFFAYQSLVQHEAQIHSIGAKRVTCEICGKSYNIEKGLRAHIKVAHQRQLKCVFCEKRFGRKNQLEAHLNTHTNTKPFKCDICEVGFAHSGTLYRHRKGKAHLEKQKEMTPIM